MKQMEADKVIWRRATQEEERGASIPDDLHVRLVGSPTLDGHRVLLRAGLANHSDTVVEVVTFYSFVVEVIVTENLAPKPYEGPRNLPPVPPPGRVFTIPGNTEVLFNASVDFDRFNARTFENAALRWSFGYWARPRPSGVIILSDEITAALDAN